MYIHEHNNEDKMQEKYRFTTIRSREIVIVENIRLVCLLDLTADFKVKTNTKLTPI